jgi:nucleotide-binding universal stress UspA family protein
MFDHILVPLDGSRLAEAALPAAAFLAATFSSRVTLLHVVEPGAPRQVHGQPHLPDAAAARAYLQRIMRSGFSEGTPVAGHVHDAAVADVAAGIADHAGELDHDLIVMCVHGRGRALHLMLGSIAQKVIARGPIPVLVVRPDRDGAAPAFSCRAILAPLDGAAGHEAALPVAGALAEACSATLHLEAVVPTFGALSDLKAAVGRLLPGTMARLLDLSVEKAENYLLEKADGLRRNGIEAFAHVRRGHPARVIATSARRWAIDLIVLASHGRWGMEAFWEGSVAHQVSNRCQVPLLLVPAPKMEPAGREAAQK